MKNLTQAELGELLGVTNQAVSKWESAVSMPDIMLLPAIAETLGITLDMLYGLDKNEFTKVTADDFPVKAYYHLIKYFYDQSGARFSNMNPADKIQLTEWLHEISKGHMLGCISDTEGAIVISYNFSFIDTEYKKNGIENYLQSKELSGVLNILSDVNCRKILAYQYSKSFPQQVTDDIAFCLEDICENCDLSETDAFDALEQLTSIKLETKEITKAHQAIYYFEKSAAVYLIPIFRLAELLISDPFWQVIRDSSLIADYTFEKLWK